MPAPSRTVDRSADARAGQGAPQHRRRRRRRRRAHPADALVIVAVAALAAGLLGAKRLGVAPQQPTPAAGTTSVATAAAIVEPAPATDATIVAPWSTASPPPAPTTAPPPAPVDSLRFEHDQPFAFGAALPVPFTEPPFAVRAPDTARPVRVLVVGDGLATGLADGLGRLGATTGLAVRARTVAASGLARPDLFDWPAQIASTVTPADELVVVFVGLNDAQMLTRWTTQPGAVGSASWTEAYRARVARVVAGAGPRPVVLVGLATAESPARDHELEAVRAAVAAESTAHANVRYIDLRAATSDDGRFARWLDQGDGRQVAARSNDGERFTDAGNDLIAAALVAAVWPAH